MQTLRELWLSTFADERPYPQPFAPDNFCQLLQVALQSDKLDSKELKDLLYQYEGDNLKTVLNTPYQGDIFVEMAVRHFLAKDKREGNNLITYADKVLLLLKHGADFTANMLAAIKGHNSFPHRVAMLAICLHVQLGLPFHLAQILAKGVDGRVECIILNIKDVCAYQLKQAYAGYVELLKQSRRFFGKFEHKKNARGFIDVSFSFVNHEEAMFFIEVMQQNWPALMGLQQEKFTESFTKVKSSLAELESPEKMRAIVKLGSSQGVAMTRAERQAARLQYVEVYNHFLDLFCSSAFFEKQKEAYAWFTGKFLPQLEVAFDTSCQTEVGYSDLLADFLPNIERQMKVNSYLYFVTFPVKHNDAYSFLYARAYIQHGFKNNCLRPSAKQFASTAVADTFDVHTALRALVSCQDFCQQDPLRKVVFQLLDLKLQMCQGVMDSVIIASMHKVSETLKYLKPSVKDDNRIIDKSRVLFYQFNGLQDNIAYYVEKKSAVFTQEMRSFIATIIEIVKPYTHAKNLPAKISGVEPAKHQHLCAVIVQTAKKLNASLRQLDTHLVKQIHRCHTQAVAQRKIKAEEIKRKKAERNKADREQRMERERERQKELLRKQQLEEQNARGAESLHASSELQLAQPKAEPPVSSLKVSDSLEVGVESVPEADLRISPEEKAADKAEKRLAYERRFAQGGAEAAEVVAGDAPAVRYYIKTTMLRCFYITVSENVHKHLTPAEIEELQRFLQKDLKICLQGNGVKPLHTPERVKLGLPDDVTYKLKFNLFNRKQVRIFCREQKTPEGVELVVCHSVIKGKKVHRQR